MPVKIVNVESGSEQPKANSTKSFKIVTEGNATKPAAEGQADALQGPSDPAPMPIDGQQPIRDAIAKLDAERVVREPTFQSNTGNMQNGVLDNSQGLGLNDRPVISKGKK